jgi:hypothetical protein
VPFCGLTPLIFAWKIRELLGLALFFADHPLPLN